MTRASDIIDTGDPWAILRMAWNARSRAILGEFCQCENPDLHDMDLMCGNCLLENEGQRAKKLAWIRGHHAFEPMEESGIKRRFCRICACLDTDDRHQATHGGGA